MWIKRRMLMFGINLLKDDNINVNSVDFKEKIADTLKNYVIDHWDTVVSFEDGDNEILVKVDL
jgi:type IV secretory pathway component VirB8